MIVGQTQERRRRRRRGLPAPLWAFLLSLAGHLVFVGLLLLLSRVQLAGPEEPRAPRAVSLRTLSPAQWARNRGAAPPGPTSEGRGVASAPKPPEPKKEPRPDGQVVDVAPGNGEEAPDARHLAESTNRAEKETRAREQTAFYRNAMPRRTTTTPSEGVGADPVERAQRAGNHGLGDDSRPPRAADKPRQSLEIPHVRSRQEVALRERAAGEGPGPQVANRTESAEVLGNSDRLRIQRGEPGGEGEPSTGRKGSPGIANLLPSMAALGRVTGAAPNDGLMDLEEGEGTFLNTKEWKYASFFNRVKQNVGMHWDPSGQLRQRDPTGNIYGGRDRYTVLDVTLDEQGMVKDIHIQKSCGLGFLDQEAVQSFERAQPFPNPPPGLVTDSTVRFSFGFFLDMGGPRLRLFRQGG